MVTYVKANFIQSSHVRETARETETRREATLGSRDRVKGLFIL